MHLFTTECTDFEVRHASRRDMLAISTLVRVAIDKHANTLMGSKFTVQ